MVSVAGRPRARIEAAARRGRGARAATGSSRSSARGCSSAAPLPDGDEETKLTVYVGRGERADGRPAYAAVVDAAASPRRRGATVLLGVDGTAPASAAARASSPRNAQVPLMVVAIGAGDAHRRRRCPSCARCWPTPLLPSSACACASATAGASALPEPVAATDPSGWPLWQKLMVYCGEQSRHAQRPLYSELVRALRTAGAAGATALRGIWGYHGDHAPHGDSFWQLRRRVPVVTVIVDTPAAHRALVRHRRRGHRRDRARDQRAGSRRARHRPGHRPRRIAARRPGSTLRTWRTSTRTATAITTTARRPTPTAAGWGSRWASSRPSWSSRSSPGILADSLALLSDAAHMLTDAGAIARRAVRRRAGGAAGRGALHLRPRARRDPVGPGQRRDPAGAGGRHRRRGDPAPLVAARRRGRLRARRRPARRVREHRRRHGARQGPATLAERRGRPRPRAHRPLRVARRRDRRRRRAHHGLQPRRRDRLALGGRADAALGPAAPARGRPRSAGGRPRGRRPAGRRPRPGRLPGRGRGPRPAHLGGHLGLPRAGRARARRPGRRLPRRAPRRCRRMVGERFGIEHVTLQVDHAPAGDRLLEIEPRR